MHAVSENPNLRDDVTQHSLIDIMTANRAKWVQKIFIYHLLEKGYYKLSVKWLCIHFCSSNWLNRA